MTLLSTLDYLAFEHHWSPTSQKGDQLFYGLCPIHPERDPSFLVNRDDSWHCFNESGCGGYTYHLIMQLEGLPEDAAKKRWYELSRKYYGAPSSPSPSSSGSPLKHWDGVRTHQYANPEQRTLLTAAMHWWHHQLFSGTRERGRQFATTVKGYSLPDLSWSHQIGYAPRFTRDVEGQALKSSFVHTLEDALGKTRWKEVAQEMHLIKVRDDGILTMSVQDRLMSCSTNEHGECVFYHGRKVVLGDEPEEKKFKHLTTASLSTVPFQLPVLSPTRSILVHTEAPAGPALFLPYGVRCIGWMSATPSVAHLRAMRREGETHVLFFDNDLPRKRRDGTVYYPGRVYAEQFSRVCEEAGHPWVVVEAPREMKDEAWIARCGIQPFFSLVSQRLEEKGYQKQRESGTIKTAELSLSH